MATRRTRSAERTGINAVEAEVLHRLTNVLEEMRTEGRRPGPPQFKAPEFDGSGDVEYFIQQFEDVVMANEWRPLASILHLREVLKDAARECGKAGTVEGIFENLRVRFGMTVRGAQAQLSILKRDFKTSLQQHAALVEKLVTVAYPDLPPVHRNIMMRDTFTNTLGHAGLQRHLLAVPTPTLADAVRAGNEYLQIQSLFPGSSHIRQIDEDGEDVLNVTQARNDSLTNISKVLQKLVAEMAELQANQHRYINRRSERQPIREPLKCWGCGQEGHPHRSCPTHPRKTRKFPNTGPGNEESPQQ